MIYGKDRDEAVRKIMSEVNMIRGMSKDPNDNYMQRGYAMSELMFFVYDVREECVRDEERR